MRDLLTETATRAYRYLENVAERNVAPTPEALDGLKAFDEALPDVPQSPEDILALLDNAGSPATIASAGRRYFGFVTGGALPATIAANWMAAAWDQNAGLEVISPVGAYLENIVLRWLVDLLELPEGTGGGLVTGATMANFAGLAAARHAVLSAAGWDVDADGLFGAPPITVIVGDEVHASLLKALALLGLGRDRIVRVPADGQGRFRAERLPQISGPTIVCLQGGNVNTGAFDPAEPICAAAGEAGAWVHVDAAFGMWAAASPEYRHLWRGYEQADSWATDAHKWLNVPYDCGLVFCRQPQFLASAMSASAAYLMELGHREPSHYTPEMSRRARAIEVWAALRSLGRKGVADLVEQNCRQARRFADGLEAAGHTVHNEVVLNQVIVSFRDAEHTAKVIKALHAEGTCWCGITEWQGKTAMRISVSSWATTDADVEQSLRAMLNLAEKVE